MYNLETYEREIIELEKEEFLGKANYDSDLSTYRDKSRAKVRARRKKGRNLKKEVYSVSDTLAFRISKKIRELEEELTSIDSLTPKQKEKLIKELDLLHAAIENILAVSNDKRKLKKLLIKYKKIL